ncbi:hypothetical protein F0562_017265 [Nyssa sinensis]|uniref:Uncharacterized protein n=1 Tax=Nyssa sinensis TaxID=561372 RepID=A0A5J4ZI35_9ASTE|nr:hypothetical protein F0562_017265 [Nyssa sinensis]
MARFNESNSTLMIQLQIQATDSQEHSLPSTNPIKGQEPNTQFETRKVRHFFRKLFQNLSYLHLFLITTLIIFLTIRGLLSAAHTHHFHPWKWYPPLLASTACARIVAFAWQWLTLRNLAKAIRAAFWLAPSLTCGVGVLLVSTGSALSLAAAVVALVSALIQSLYSC